MPVLLLLLHPLWQLPVPQQQQQKQKR